MQKLRRGLLSLPLLFMLEGSLALIALGFPGIMWAGEVRPGSLAYLDAKNGFRDLKFGNPPTTDMVFWGKDPDGSEIKLYTRVQENLTIGGGQADSILYGFHKDRLFIVKIETKGGSSSRALLDVLRQGYGPGHQENQFLQEFTWFGGRVWASYKQQIFGNGAMVNFYSVPVLQELEAERKTKAKNGVGDL